MSRMVDDSLAVLGPRASVPEERPALHAADPDVIGIAGPDRAQVVVAGGASRPPALSFPATTVPGREGAASPTAQTRGIQTKDAPQRASGDQAALRRPDSTVAPHQRARRPTAQMLVALLGQTLYSAWLLLLFCTPRCCRVKRITVPYSPTAQTWLLSVPRIE